MHCDVLSLFSDISVYAESGDEETAPNVSDEIIAPAESEDLNETKDEPEGSGADEPELLTVMQALKSVAELLMDRLRAYP